MYKYSLAYPRRFVSRVGCWDFNFRISVCQSVIQSVKRCTVMNIAGVTVISVTYPVLSQLVRAVYAKHFLWSHLRNTPLSGLVSDSDISLLFCSGFDPLNGCLPCFSRPSLIFFIGCFSYFHIPRQPAASLFCRLFNVCVRLHVCSVCKYRFGWRISRPFNLA